MSNQTVNIGNMTESDNHTRPGNSGFGIPPDTIPAVVIMVFILVINSGVILLIGCYSSLRTTTNIILASLAVSDFLVGFVGIPLLVTCSSATHLSSVCASSIIFFTFMALSTVLHITVMTCDRYIYIMWALRYPEIVHRGRVFTVLGITWLISLGQSLVRLSWTWNVSIATAKEDLALVREKETIYMLFNIIVFFVVPLIVMIVLDARMLLLLRKQCQRIARENLPAEFIKREKKLQRRQRRAVLTCVLLLFLYVIFWLPYFILELVLQHHHGQIPGEIVITIYYLRLCTSVFNPLTYTLRKYDLKSRVKSIFEKMFFSWRKNDTEMEHTRATHCDGPVAV
ncbi:hypothetical protein ACROYT_G033163 [Oculina patagonica]